MAFSHYRKYGLALDSFISKTMGDRPSILDRVPNVGVRAVSLERQETAIA